MANARRVARLAGPLKLREVELANASRHFHRRNSDTLLAGLCEASQTRRWGICECGVPESAMPVLRSVAGSA